MDVGGRWCFGVFTGSAGVQDTDYVSITTMFVEWQSVNSGRYGPVQKRHFVLCGVTYYVCVISL